MLFFENPLNFRKNISLPSSSKRMGKARTQHGAEFATCLDLVPCSAYSRMLIMEETCFSVTYPSLKGPQGVISHMTERSSQPPLREPQFIEMYMFMGKIKAINM
jgi:hypothetical protein